MRDRRYQTSGQQRRSQQPGPSPIIVGLLIQLFSQLEKSEYKPPITIALLFFNIYVHVAPYPHVLDFDLTNIRQNCILPGEIVRSFFTKGELQLNRFVLSSVMHVDDMHLYYNMLSLCWKGINLEKHMGSLAFLKLVCFSVVASSSLMVLIAVSLNAIGVSDALTGMSSCAVGFSAVLFSLKVVWNMVYAPKTTTVPMLGIAVPSQYAAWLELVLISLMTPSASFLGHLAGILAGVIYIKYLRELQVMR